MIENSLNEIYSVQDVEGVNASGIVNDVRICPIHFIDSIKIPRNTIMLEPNAIVLKKNKSFISLIPVHDSIYWEESMIKTNHGICWKQDVVFEQSKNRPELTNFFDRYAEVPFIMVLVDRHKQPRLIGTVEEPLLVNELNSTVGKRGGKNFENPHFVAETRRRSFYLSENDDIASYILATKYSNLLVSQIGTIRDRLAVIEQNQAFFNGQMFKLYTYNHSNNSILMLSDWTTINLDKTMILFCTVNGVNLNGRISNTLPEANDMSDSDEYIIGNFVGNKVIVFNQKTSLLTDSINIIQILIKNDI